MHTGGGSRLVAAQDATCTDPGHAQRECEDKQLLKADWVEMERRRPSRKVRQKEQRRYLCNHMNINGHYMEKYLASEHIENPHLTWGFTASNIHADAYRMVIKCTGSLAGSYLLIQAECSKSKAVPDYELLIFNLNGADFGAAIPVRNCLSRV